MYQERIIKRGGGRACNFRRFWTGQNNPPVLFIEHSFAQEILIAWQDSVYARVRVYVPYSSYNGKFWMCQQRCCIGGFTGAATGAEGEADNDC